MDFLENPYDEDNEGGGATFVGHGLVTFSPAFKAGWSQEDVKYFPFDGSKEAQYKAKQEASEYIKEAGLDNTFPQLGILVEIPVDTYLDAPDSFNYDVVRFVNSYHSDRMQIENTNSKLTDEEKARVTGKMPYDEVIDALRQFPQVIRSTTWMKFEQVVDQYSVAKDSRNSGGYHYRVYVPREIYANEAEARAAVGVEPAPDEFDSFGGEADNTISDLAAKNGWSLLDIMTALPSVEHTIKEARMGKKTGTRMSESEATIFACKDWNIEVGDLNLARKTPF